jgi:hypothetical protein
LNSDVVRHAIAASIRITFDGEHAWAETQCLYPSNASVIVRIAGGTSTFHVSDNAGAVHEAYSCGIPADKAKDAVTRIARNQGLLFGNDEILSPPVEVDALGAAAVLVANASQEAAHWLLSHVKVRAPRNFRQELADLLIRSFRDELRHNQPIVGASNKTHRFEHVIALANGSKILIDPVVNEASSINARVVANLDIRNANIPHTEQRIVYDDLEDWKASDLSLLQIGAPIVPFTSAHGVIERLRTYL